ncbi:MAG: UbiA family prenyltransferase [Candidatus Aenigmarchaeota archaeon]|nr:UbiA family prenyltransferase [Candidatus Aenigmarchaeota archaeon]
MMFNEIAMKLAEIDFRLYLINLFKNIITFFILPAHYFLIYGNISNLFSLFLGLFGFLLAYHSIYYLNDLMDYEEDKNDEIKNKIKPLINKRITKETAISLMFIYSIIGLSISFYVNTLFGFAVFLSLFFNFLHSSNFTRLKKTKLCKLNFFFLQSSKVSASWFILSNSLLNFPFFLVFLYSSVYLFFYIFYKNIKNLDNYKIYYKIKLLGIPVILFFILSLFVYPYKLLLISIGCFSITIITFYIYKSKKFSELLTIKIGNYLFFISAFIIFLFSVLLCSSQSVALIDNELNKTFEPISKNITILQEKIIIDFESNFYKLAKLSNSMNPSWTFPIENFKFPPS